MERARGSLINPLQFELSLACTALKGKKFLYGVKDVAEPSAHKNQIDQSGGLLRPPLAIMVNRHLTERRGQAAIAGPVDGLGANA
jgi:hypothetical protein